MFLCERLCVHPGPGGCRHVLQQWGYSWPWMVQGGCGFGLLCACGAEMEQAVLQVRGAGYMGALCLAEQPPGERETPHLQIPRSGLYSWRFTGLSFVPRESCP